MLAPEVAYAHPMGMKWLATILVSAMLSTAADDPWAKVKDLKSGTAIRVVRTGEKSAVEAEFLDLTDERLILAIKKTQTSILREEIDRIEARASQKSYQRDSKVTNTDPNQQLARPTPGRPVTPPLQSSGSGVTFTRPGYELVYHKTASK